jgi:hypothetical protein
MDSNIVKGEIQTSLDFDTGRWNADPCKVGLFTNNLDDTLLDHVIGDITPCAGAGYSGLQNLDSWPAALWTSPEWISTHPDITWTFDGSATRTIRGCYVVDSVGVLAAWRKFAGAGITVGFFAGQTFVLSPKRKRESYV